MRERLFQIVQQSIDGDIASRIYDIFITLMALISILPIVVEGFTLTPEATVFFKYVEIFSVVVLFCDYILRWATHDYRIQKFTWTAFLRYPFSPFAIITIIAIAPSFNWVPRSLGYLRLLRFVVLFRNVRGFQLLITVIKKQKRVLVTILVVSMLYLVTSAVIMAALEPGMFDNPFDALLFVSTIDSIMVGHPSTLPGALFGSFTFICGIALVMMPVGVLTAGFTEEIQQHSVGLGIQYSRTDLRLFKNVFKNGMAGIAFSLKMNKTMQLYSMFFAISLVGSIVLNALLGQGFVLSWLGLLGVAFVSYMLEPVAGVIMALILGSIVALVTGDVSNILSVFFNVVIIACYGCILRRTRALTARRVAMIFVLVLLAYPPMVYLLSRIASHLLFATYLDSPVLDFCLNLGCSFDISQCLACTIDVQLSTLAMLPLILLLRRVFKKQVDYLNYWAAKQKERRLANGMFMPPELASIEYTTAGVYDPNSRCKWGYPDKPASESKDKANAVSLGIWIQGQNVRVQLYDTKKNLLGTRILIVDNVFDQEAYGIIGGATRELLKENQCDKKRLAAIGIVLPWSYKQDGDSETWKHLGMDGVASPGPLDRYMKEFMDSYPSASLQVFYDDDLFTKALKVPYLYVKQDDADDVEDAEVERLKQIYSETEKVDARH